MSRKIRYEDDVRGIIETYISNEASDFIIDFIEKSRTSYHGKNDIKIVQNKGLLEEKE